ncbi:PTS lactose/cellobiose transporter subunit IIA [Longicatena caecimuris]|uniref:PTS lactose/cellobiose transporter subunit IIA n=1 Tax=Longicatena caecimuris TaxID=1796635 RepID=UPI003AB4BA9C
MENEQKAFELILHSGNARSLAHEALELIKANEKEQAEKKLKEADTELIEAQKLHARFLRDMANNEEIKIDLLMVHAEDHVSGSQTCLEMAKEIVAIYERLDLNDK